MTDIKNKFNQITKDAGFSINENKTIFTYGIIIVSFSVLEDLERAIRLFSGEFKVSAEIDRLTLAILY